MMFHDVRVFHNTRTTGTYYVDTSLSYFAFAGTFAQTFVLNLSSRIASIMFFSKNRLFYFHPGGVVIVIILFLLLSRNNLSLLKVQRTDKELLRAKVWAKANMKVKASTL